MPDAPLKATRGPWVGGYTSSVPPFMARPDQLVGATDGSDTNSSRDCFIDPFTGGVSKRPGSAIMGDTTDGTGTQTSGIYNTGLSVTVSYTHLTLPTIERCRSRWSPYH